MTVNRSSSALTKHFWEFEEYQRRIHDSHKQLRWRALQHKLTAVVAKHFILDVCGSPGYASGYLILGKTLKRKIAMLKSALLIPYIAARKRKR